MAPTAGYVDDLARGETCLRTYWPSLRRHGNNAAGKSAAERRSRGGRGVKGRGLGSGAITLR